MSNISRTMYVPVAYPCARYLEKSPDRRVIVLMTNLYRNPESAVTVFIIQFKG